MKIFTLNLTSDDCSAADNITVCSSLDEHLIESLMLEAESLREQDEEKCNDFLTALYRTSHPDDRVAIWVTEGDYFYTDSMVLM